MNISGSVTTVDELKMTFDHEPWAFADGRRADIDAYFAERLRTQPAIWNGQVLMLGRFALADGVMRGHWFKTDYASMLAWKAWDAPDRTVRNGFALGAIRSTDGAFLLGVMGDHTANAGKIYFPAGTPDLDDVVGEGVDLAGSVLRELEEETGLTAADFSIASDWQVVDPGPPRLALVRLLQAREEAQALRDRILRHLAAEEKPELADIRIVRGPDDLDPMMPDFVAIYLRHQWDSNAA